MDDGHMLGEFDLPRESRLLQGLARKVLADEHLAADVAQETWLTLLRNGTQRLTSPRSFVKRVAHNIAVDVVRSKDRRRHREERHVRPVTSPGADEVAHASNVRERMLAALDDLAPKYGEVLRLRYYESLSPPAIAERLDVPLETVRTRLKRGMAQLKRRLEREFREDPAGWPWALGALLPAGERALPPAASAPGPGLATAGAWAGRRAALVAAAVLAPTLLIVLGWSAWTARGPEAAAPLERPVRIATAATPDLIATPDGRSALATNVLVEVVLDEDGAPLAGTFLELAWDGGRANGTTDADGRLQAAVPAGARLSIDVEATSATSRAVREVEVRPSFDAMADAAADPAAAAFVVTVRVLSRRSIAGRVLDLTGAPVAGARVAAYRTREDLLERRRPVKTVRSDARGAYRMHGLPDSFFAQASDKKRISFVALRGRGVAVQDFDGIDFRLAPGGRFEGDVLADDGRPLGEVEVSVRSAHSKVAVDPFPGMQYIKPFRRVLTDRRGRFSIDDLPYGRYTVSASKPPLVSDWTSVNLARAEESLELRLRFGANASIAVWDEHDAPLEGARVSLWRGHAASEPDLPFAHPEPQQHRTSGRDGTALFGGQLADAPLLVVVRAEGYATQVLGPFTPPLELDVRLEHARRFEGRILDPSGAPLTDAHAILRPALDYPALIETGLDRYCEQSLPDNRVYADREGRFTCEDAPHGPLTILAAARTADGAMLVHEVHAEADAQRAEIVLQAALRVEGRVVDARTSAPLEEARVIASSRAVGQRWDTFTDAGGGYRIDLPEAPDWALVFQKEGYARSCLRPDEARGGTLDAALEAPCRLELEIVDAEGVPVTSARVELQTRDGHPVLTGTWEGRGWELGDPLGRVLFGDAPRVPLIASVHVPELHEPRTYRFDLSEGDGGTRRLVLEGFASTAPTQPVAIHLQAAPGLAQPEWSWGPPEADRDGYAGPVELVVTDAQGRTTLHVAGSGEAPRDPGRALRTTSRLTSRRHVEPPNLRRIAALESWPGSSAWSPLPVSDPLSAVPLPAGRGTLVLRLAGRELSIPIGASGPRGSSLTVVVPAR